MSRDVIAQGRGAVLRGLALWSTTTAVALALPALLATELRMAAGAIRGDLAGHPFDALLTAGCAVALSACALWAWLVTTVTLVLALAGSARRVPGCPDAARRLVLAACGLALATAATPAAYAETGAGSPPSPSPDRTAAAAARVAPAQDAGRESASVLQVRAGDSLWALAAQALPADATTAEVDDAWRALWAANRDTVGDDPDLIHPGTELHRPSETWPTTKERR